MGIDRQPEPFANRAPRTWRVAYGTNIVLVSAVNSREAVSVVRDELDKRFRRKGYKLTVADDFTVREAYPSEVALTASAHRRRKDQGVMFG